MCIGRQGVCTFCNSWMSAESVAIESLQQRKISKAAAWQRTGRAGREVRLSSYTS